MEQEAKYLGLKTSAFIFFFVYGNAALNVTMYAMFFKILGLLDVSWLYVFSFFLAPLAVLGTVLALHLIGKMLQYPANLFAKLVSRPNNCDPEL